jgi:hypothetical protein
MIPKYHEIINALSLTEYVNFENCYHKFSVHGKSTLGDKGLMMKAETLPAVTDTLLSMMECDIEETVNRKLKERFSREPVEVYQR